jgi:hypothetical protein
MKAIRNTGIIFLLMVYLFGTTGVSMLHHICSSSKQHDVTLYPELFTDPEIPCCGDEPQDVCVCSHEADHPDKSSARAVAPSGCCASNISFLKLDIFTLRIEKLLIGQEYKELPIYHIITPSELFSKQPATPVLYFQFASPPPVIYGKELVYRIHQVKIPTPHFIDFCRV